jgi:SAM-dependent methyltransferase
MDSSMTSTKITSCLACGNSELIDTLDLGNQPLANSYKKTKDEDELYFPLKIVRCKKCFHVQLTEAVNPDLMFKNYLYVTGTSRTMLDYCKWFADWTLEYFRNFVDDRVLLKVFDIGCNDGTQLDFYQTNSETHCKTYGVDPATNLHPDSSKKGHRIDLEYFNAEYINQYEPPHCDIVVAQNVFAHNEDPVSFMHNAKKILADDGLFFIQTSQSDMILNNEFDTIYHEHISFYNIQSMNELCKRTGMNLVDVVKTTLHGNSYVFVVSKTAKREAHIKNLIEMERRAGLYSDVTYEKYAEKCNKVIEEIKAFNYFQRGLNRTLIGYGAAAKGNTFLNAAKLDLDYVIDDNPLKQNLFTPGQSIPIVSSDILDSFPPGDTLVFIPLAWNFYKEIVGNIKKKRPNSTDLYIKYFPELTKEFR